MVQVQYIHVFEMDHCSKAAEGACSKEVRSELHYQGGRIAHRKGDREKWEGSGLYMIAGQSVFFGKVGFKILNLWGWRYKFISQNMFNCTSYVGHSLLKQPELWLTPDPGELPQAMREYKQSVDLMPQHHAAVYTLAQCLVQRKQFSPAIKLLENSPKNMQEEPEARQLKQWDNALSMWQRISQMIGTSLFNRAPSLWKRCSVSNSNFVPQDAKFQKATIRVVSCSVCVMPAFCAMFFGKWCRFWSFWSLRILPKMILKGTKRRVSNFTYLSLRLEKK